MALEYMAKGLEQSAAARAERAVRDSATLKTHRGCPLGSQRVALGSNHNKRGVTDKEEEIRKAKKSIDETTAFIEKVEVEMAERPDAYWTVVSAFSESSKKNTPKRTILNTMVRLFISDEKIRASIRKEKAVADIRARFVKETEDLGGIDMSQLGVDRRLHSF
jgi:hypothetical protein